MIESPATGDRPETLSAAAGAPALRERVRAIIHEEVDRLRPTEDARRPLELIVESSVRYTETDGRVAIAVVDEKGQPRTVERDGRSVPITLPEFLEDFRRAHPALFLAPDDARATPEARSEAAAPAPPVEASAQPEPVAAAGRDWLDVGPSGAAERGTAPSRLGDAGQSLREAIDALRYRFRPGLGAGGLASGVGLVPEAPMAGETRRAGLALGVAAAIAALLLGLAAFALLGGDDSARQAERAAPEPSATGTIAPSAATAAPTAPASSASRALRGVPDVLDTATLSLQGEVVRLFGVEWAPGAGKPDDLTRYLQGREVECDPAGGNDTYRCKVGGQDLSRVVLFNGGGRPNQDATPELKAAADQARAAKIGVWAP